MPNSDLQPASNATELSVSELSQRLKRTIEDNFDFVRVRGELGRVTIARSGHMYADLKDENAVLSTVMWKGNVGRLAFRPEEGLEVIAEGKLSTFPGRSAYQLIADSMRPAGVGALMALLEERRKKLTAEGLFDPARKKPIPYLPRTIGVVTSPTGAVIRDILHRLADRFPVRVIVWPALVQGDLAAGQIEAGIRGFNAMPEADRPDLIIVARGGGSIEDLWPFNEENVVRAAAESIIPLISGVGHETDTTLIDHAADRRAPTPTGAAEMAVPVLSDLILEVQGRENRLLRALRRVASVARTDLRAASARLPRPEQLVGMRRQRLDMAETRLARGLERGVARSRKRLTDASQRLPNLRDIIGGQDKKLSLLAQRLPLALRSVIQTGQRKLARPADRLRPALVIADNRRKRQHLSALSGRAGTALTRQTDAGRARLSTAGKLLDSLSHQSVLARGFALVRDGAGRVVKEASAASSQQRLTLTFVDGDVSVTPVDATAPAGTPPAGKPAPRSAARPSDPPGKQGNLF